MTSMMGRCRDCGEIRTLDLDKLCHPCWQARQENLTPTHVYTCKLHGAVAFSMRPLQVRLTTGRAAHCPACGSVLVYHHTERSA